MKTMFGFASATAGTGIPMVPVTHAAASAPLLFNTLRRATPTSSTRSSKSFWVFILVPPAKLFLTSPTIEWQCHTQKVRYFGDSQALQQSSICISLNCTHERLELVRLAIFFDRLAVTLK